MRLRSGILSLPVLFLFLKPAAALDPGVYDLRAEPLAPAQTQLLSDNRFLIKPEGEIIDPVTAQPLLKSDMPFVLQRLESGQRLKALLQLQIILDRNRSEKDMPKEDRAAIRQVVRENWHLFSLKTRKEFRGYFTLQELEPMNQVPLPRAWLHEPELKDHTPAPDEPTDQPKAKSLAVAMPSVLVPLGPAVSAAAAAPDAAAPPTAPPAAPDTASSMSRKPLTAPASAAAARSPAAHSPEQFGVAQPWAPGQTMDMPKAPAVAPIVEMPPPPAAAPEASAQPAAEPPAPLAPAASAAPQPAVSSSSAAQLSPAASPPPSAAPIAKAPEPAPQNQLPLRPISVEDFDRFLVDAPYTQDVKALFRLISAKAPDFIRSRVLNDLIAVMPQIVVETERSLDAAHSRLLPGTTSAIALNPGLALYERRKLLLGGELMLLSLSQKAYSEAGLPLPGLQALTRSDLPKKQEPGPWGQTSIFPDNSQRALFGPELQAGYLLAELVRLDARLRGWQAGAYASEVAARTAQFMFYDSISRDLRHDGFLDPETRLSFRQWLDRPEEYRDLLLHSLSASRSGVIDPRKAGLYAVSEFDRRALTYCEKASLEDAAFRDGLARQARSA
ncbi:MAG: hypothetical protein WC881_00100, partial [Elusimicrobiota bacterium]